MPILEGKRLRRVTEDGTVLLDDVSLCVSAGEVVGIVGPPGSGKTLLLRALALLDPLDSGEMCYEGERVSDEAVPAFRRKVVYVQQRATLVEGTVRDNLMLPFAFQSAEARSFKPEEVIRWMMSLGRSDGFLERTVADLSGGETQLVTLLRALQLDPAVLLLDEPTSSLDEQTRQAVESLLRDWMQTDRPSHSRQTGRAMLIVTHDLSQAERICDRIVRLEGGRES